jgi:hypothetical protein
MTRASSAAAIDAAKAQIDTAAVVARQSGEAPNTPRAGTPATAEMRLQILATEHWSLLASRALAWNESFSRGSMFLSTLSFATVALALAAQASNFGEGFRLVAFVGLAVLLFLGIGTMLRLDSATLHDATCVAGMNRIRHAYLELAPDLEPYFIMGATDDVRGILTTMVNPPGRSTPVAMVAATPFQVSVLNAVLLAAIAALLAVQLRADTQTAAAAGAVGFGVGMLAFAWYGRRGVVAMIREYRPRFPSPANTDPRSASSESGQA